MGHTQVSIPKQGISPGTPGAKSPNIYLVDVEDIDTMPTRTEGDVIADGDLKIKAEAKAIRLYATRSTIKRKDTQEGTADAKGFKSELEFEHPGDSAEVNSFAENGVNKGFVIITTECNDETAMRMQGTPCNPMYMTIEEQDDTEAKKKTFKFAQEQRDKYKMTHYKGTLPEAYPDAAPADPTPPAEEGGGL